MSWSDDMRCLYCDGKLPLYQKITNGQFCSTAHRKAYWQEQEQLAIERLHQTHNSLRAYRPPVAPEAILGPGPGPAESPIPDMGGFVTEVLVPHRVDVIAYDPSASEVELRPAAGVAHPELRPWGASGRDAATAGIIPLSNFLRDISNSPEIAYGAWEGAMAGRPAGSVPDFSGSRPKPGGVWGLATVAPLPLSSFFRDGLKRLKSLLLTRCEFGCEHVTIALSRPSVPHQDRLCLPVGQRVDLPWAGEAVDFHPDSSLRGAELDSKEIAVVPCRPSVPGLEGHFLPTAQRIELPWRGEAVAFGAAAPCANLSSLPPRASGPLLDLSTAAAELQPLAEPLATDEISFSDRLFGLPKIGAAQPPVVLAGSAYEQLTGIPAIVLVRLDLPAYSPKELPAGSLLSLGMPPSPLVHATPVTEGEIESLGGFQHPSTEGNGVGMATPIPSPRAELAMGKRSTYTVQAQTNATLPASLEPADFVILPADIALPSRAEPRRTKSNTVTPDKAASKRDLRLPPQVQAADHQPIGHGNSVPDAAGLVPLAFHFSTLSCNAGASNPVRPVVSDMARIPQPPCCDPLRPSSKLEPLNVGPDFGPPDFGPRVQPQIPAMGRGFSGMGSMPPAETASAEKTVPWAGFAEFLKKAPRDLKLLVFAIPALLALVFHPSLPKVSVAASPATGELKRDLATVVSGQLATVRQAVYERAAVSLFDDFRSGLDDWTSRGDATTKWSFDATGFVRPGPLALYSPSMGLTDYQVDFLGMIDQKALSWVIRAADFKNYHVIKLVVLKPGPLPTLGLTRYAVIEGKPQDRADTLVPIDARQDTLYRVRLDVHDDTFSLAVQGQLIDSWSDKRLRHGGIGFFSARGEESRVKWVQVTHQYDALGRLCAYLAPYDIPTTNGSW